MVLILVLAGLALIYLEFFLPSGIMAIGGSLMLLASLVLFALQTSCELFSCISFALILAVTLLLIMRIASWRIGKRGH